MATSEAAIKAVILAKMAEFPNIDETNQGVIDLVTCIAAIYTELQKLDDLSGTPPSIGHQ